MARASILWLIGEYCHLIPKIAPDVLRKAAKTFTSEVQYPNTLLYPRMPLCVCARTRARVAHVRIYSH